MPPVYKIVYFKPSRMTPSTEPCLTMSKTISIFQKETVNLAHISCFPQYTLGLRDMAKQRLWRQIWTFEFFA